LKILHSAQLDYSTMKHWSYIEIGQHFLAKIMFADRHRADNKGTCSNQKHFTTGSESSKQVVVGYSESLPCLDSSLTTRRQHCSFIWHFWQQQLRKLPDLGLSDKNTS